MLRRAENVGISHSPGLLTGKGWVTVSVGRELYRVNKIHKDEYARMLAHQLTYPIHVMRLKPRNYWLFCGKFFWDNDDLHPAQVYALLVTRKQREVQRIERAQAMIAMGRQPRPTPQRGAIPDDVKQFVWMRDHGRCVNCGSTVELQFDHVIPVSMGGGSDPANLQVLCGPCNRRKAAGLTVR